MSRRQISAHISKDLYEKIERVCEAEETDFPSTVEHLLERGVHDWQVETAVRRYREGTVSVGKAAEIADASVWRFLDVLDERGVETNYDESDLETDVRAVTGEDLID